MKKFSVILLSLAILFTFASCRKSTMNSSSSGSNTSGNTSESAVSNGGSSSAKSTSGGVKYPVSSSAKDNSKKEYKVKATDYKYKQNKKNYRASYPQLSKEGMNYSKINTLMKNTALQTINSLGTKNDGKSENVRVSYHVYYKSENFISVSFKENNNSASSVRTVNYDLKSGKSLSTSDIVSNNDALYNAVENAVKEQLSKDKASKFTSSVIKSGLKSLNVYFDSDGLGISIKVPHDLGDHEEFTVKYADTAKFRTSNAVWSRFVK